MLALCIILSAIDAQNSFAEGKIVKWKDANGVTHYGDKMPTTDAGRGNSLLNKQGTVIKKNEAFNPKADTVVAEKRSEEQLRQDTALLASYLSVEEIDLAMQRNIKSDELAISVLQQQQNNAQTSLNDVNTKIKTKYANKPIPPHLTEQATYYQTQIIKRKSDIANIASNIAQTKARYNQYKTRYLELRPREHVLAEIKVNKKSMAELVAWKSDAASRLAALQQQAVGYQRSSASIPPYILSGIQGTSDEIARADREITELSNALNKSQQTFSQ
ncbi:MAG: DUF4124 domain-containing protein [Methylophilaceae bacterium]